MACGCHSALTYPVELINIIKHDPVTYSFDFTSPEVNYWQPGDSAKLFLTVSGERIGRKLSLATLPEEGLIRVTTRIRDLRSDYKDRLSKMTVGEIAELSAPSGSFDLMRNGRPAVLLSNGVGIATMRPLIKAFEQDQSGVSKMTQINIDRHGKVYEEELSNLKGIDYQFKSLYVNNRDDYYKKLDFESQQIMFSTGMLPNFYVVGSDEFIADTASHLVSSGFRLNDIYTDGKMIGQGGGCGCSSGGGCGCGSETVSSGCNCA